jgi:hypothetical protein
VREAHPSRRDRERDQRRILGVGFAISLLFHVVVVLVLSAKLALPPLHYAPGPPRVAVFEGLRTLNLRVEGAPLEAGVRPPRPARPERSEEGGSPAGARPSEAATAERGGELTNAEKLKPKPGDLRVWQGIRPSELPPPTMEELARADSAIRAILGAYLDSLALSAEAERRAREWLVHKGDKSWGIAPDGLHLGKIVIPIPFGQLFQATGDKGRELRQQLRDLEIIRYQDALDEARKVRAEREKAMLQRSLEQARKLRPDTSSASPDTTGDGARLPP